MIAMTEERPPEHLAADGRRGGISPWARLSRSHARTLVAALLCGGVAAAYAYFVGCRTGSCPITASVWSASLYGALVGAVAGWPARALERTARSPSSSDVL
jgi:hypothetical protein